jgi:hypothetical protein
MYALDALTGKNMWSHQTMGEVASSPAVSGNLVLVGSYDGNLYAVDRANGNLVWSFLTGDWVVSSPAVFDGVVYFGSYDHSIYAIGTVQTLPNLTPQPVLVLLSTLLGVVALVVIVLAIVWIKKRGVKLLPPNFRSKMNF